MATMTETEQTADTAANTEKAKKMEVDLEQVKKKMNEVQEQSENTKQILQTIVDNGSEISILLSLVSAGVMAEVPLATPLFNTISGALGYAAEGAALNPAALVLISGVVVSVSALVKLLEVKENQKNVDAVNEGLAQWSEFYLTELEKSKQEVDKSIIDLTDLLSEQLSEITSTAEYEMEWNKVLKMNGILLGLKHGIVRFKNLIDAAQAQLNLLRNAANEAKANAERAKKGATWTIVSGVIVAVVGAVVIVASGGVAFPIVAGVIAVAGGAAATVMGVITRNLADDQIAQLNAALASMDAYQARLDGYRQDVNNQVDQLNALTESLGIRLGALKEQIDLTKDQAARLMDLLAQQRRMEQELNDIRKQLGTKDLPQNETGN